MKSNKTMAILKILTAVDLHDKRCLTMKRELVWVLQNGNFAPR